LHVFRVEEDSPRCERSLRVSLRELGLTPATRERVLPTKPEEKQPVSGFDLLRAAKKEKQ